MNRFGEALHNGIFLYLGAWIVGGIWLGIGIPIFVVLISTTIIAVIGTIAGLWPYYLTAVPKEKYQQILESTRQLEVWHRHYNDAVLEGKDRVEAIAVADRGKPLAIPGKVTPKMIAGMGFDEGTAALVAKVGASANVPLYPAGSISMYEGTPLPHGIECRCLHCLQSRDCDERYEWARQQWKERR